jgi:hypothetical protein
MKRYVKKFYCGGCKKLYNKDNLRIEMPLSLACNTCERRIV